MNEYTTDARELDTLYLATIGGVDFYEVRQIVKQDAGGRSVVGRGSDWPIISRDAQIRELTALLTASEARSVEADTHCAELISRQTGYLDHIAALEAALSRELPSIAKQDAAQAEQPAPAVGPGACVQAAAPIEPAEMAKDGKIPCDWPGCDARVKPQGIGAHKARQHGYRVASPPPPTPPIALELPELPWRCANPSCSGAHARSVSDPAHCIRCVVEALAPYTNGHQAVA